MAADGVAEGAVFFVDGAGFGEEGGEFFVGGERIWEGLALRFHAIEGPEEIDGGGAGLGEVGGGFG